MDSVDSAEAAPYGHTAEGPVCSTASIASDSRATTPQISDTRNVTKLTFRTTFDPIVTTVADRAVYVPHLLESQSRQDEGWGKGGIEVLQLKAQNRRELST